MTALSDQDVIYRWTMLAWCVALLAAAIVLAVRLRQIRADGVQEQPRDVLRLLTEPAPAGRHALGVSHHEETTPTGRIRGLLERMSDAEAERAGRDPHYIGRHRGEA